MSPSHDDTFLVVDHSLTTDVPFPHLQVEDFTMGYVMDRRLGNTGGLGGAFGFFWGIGCPLPYPEGKPWSSSWQQRVSVTF